MRPKPSNKPQKQAFRPELRGASIIVLTGPSGAGKSSLAQALVRLGWQYLDGDALARSLYVPGSALLRKIARAFGSGVLREDGSLNRVHLGEIVFPSLAQRRRLNALVYPHFIREVKRELKLARAEKLHVVADLAVYFDAGAPKLGAPVVLVDAPLILRINRLRERGLTLARAKHQAAALHFGAVQRSKANLVLDGRLSKATLQRQLLFQLRSTPD